MQNSSFSPRRSRARRRSRSRQRRSSHRHPKMSTISRPSRLGRQSFRRRRRSHSPITWTPWSVHTNFSPKKKEPKSSPVLHRAIVRLPWQDVRRLRHRIYKDQPHEALRIMAEYGVSATTKLRAPDVDFNTPFDLARIAKARKCLSHFLGLRARAFIIISKARKKFLAYILRRNQGPCVYVTSILKGTVGEHPTKCLLHYRPSKAIVPVPRCSRTQSFHSTYWQPLPDLRPMNRSCVDGLDADTRTCTTTNIGACIGVDGSHTVQLLPHLREFVLSRSKKRKPSRKRPCSHALCWICGVLFHEGLCERAWIRIMQFYLPSVVDFPLMSTATLVPPRLWPKKTGVHSEPQLPRDERQCANCVVS